MTNVRTEDVRNYIEAYHKEIKRKAENSLGSDADNLEAYKLSKMNYRIMVSTSPTSGGVCVEYGKDIISVTEEHSPQSLALMLLRPVLSIKQKQVAYSFSESRNVSIYDTRITDLLPFKIDGMSSLTLRDVTVESDGITKNIYYAEAEGNRDITIWSEINAVRRASDVLLQALTDKNKALLEGVPLHEYIANYKERSVLLLGNYDQDGRDRLNEIRLVLESTYNVIIVDDIPDDPNHTLSQKVSLVGKLCRFVIVDDSSPSVHIQEIELAKQLNWITILMHENGRRSTFMNADFSLTSSNFHEENYTMSNVAEKIRSVTAWAEDYLRSRRGQLKATYPWRRN